MKWAYDLHIHTAASPCGDDLMTPNNIVNMSLLKGLDIIAITDHQTVINCEAVIEVGKEKGLKVIPGMEIECMEEFHMIALFPDVSAACKMEAWLEQYMPPVKNNIKVFGHQWMTDIEDEYIKEIDKMLLIAAQISAKEIINQVRRLGAVIYPAHIDRRSYSIISNLGTIPPEYGFKAVEISKQAVSKEYEKDYGQYTILQSSDAHYLEDIAERQYFITDFQIKELGILIK